MSKLDDAVRTAIIKGPNHQVAPNVDKENINKNLTSKTWDDMDRLYDDLAKMLANNSESFKTLIEISKNELKDFIEIEEKNEIDILFNGYVRDLDSICNDMLKIKKSHKKFSGSQKDDNELLMSISVMESYISLHDKVLAIFPPISIRLAEIVGTAAKRKEEGNSNG